MTIEEVQQKAIDIYNKNLEFLKKNNKNLFNKIKLFEEAVSLGHIKERYNLEYKEGKYFDVLDIQTQTWLYNNDSINYSRDIIKDVNYQSSKNTFKTFYEFNFEEKLVDNLKKASILSQTYLGVAPITSYVQNNLDIKQEMKDIFKFFIFGVGLGFHIPKLHEKMKAKVYLIIEPSLELFRLSLFTTDYTEIQKAKLHFAVGMDENEFKELIYILSEQTFIYDYYIKFFMFSNNCDMYINIIQNSLVSQKHLLYAFNRQLESLQRTYKYTNEKFKFINFELLRNKKISNKPVLVLAMGPSLQKNIEFVKENQEKFLIIAIYATLPILEEHSIKPDIIIQYDQQEEIVLSTIKKVKNIQFFKDSLLFFASHVNKKLVEYFPKEQIYMFTALFESKKNFKMITAPSIGEIAYAFALFFKSEEVYLLGLDLALGKDRETHSGEHKGSEAYSGMEERDNTEFLFKKSILTVKGNFREKVETLPVFKSSISQVNFFTKAYKQNNTKVYNLSDGAYFEGVASKRVNDIKLNQINTSQKIKEYIDEISSSEIREIDISYNEQKREDALKLLTILDSFHNKRKYSNIMNFKDEYFNLFEDIIYGEYECKDLQTIVLNFYKYTLPSIFHLFNMKKLDNPKKHIKQINKLLYLQTKKIFDEYLKVFNEN